MRALAKSWENGGSLLEHTLERQTLLRREANLTEGALLTKKAWKRKPREARESARRVVERPPRGR